MKNLNEVIAEIREHNFIDYANKIENIVKSEIGENYNHDLVIHRGGSSYVRYSADDVSEDDYAHHKKLVERAEKSILESKDMLKNMYVSKDQNDIKKSLKSNERFVKDWYDKVEPWMLSIIKNNKI